MEAPEKNQTHDIQQKLDKIHETLFGILKNVAELCDRHGIVYFLDAGTLLGAVRHKDFIPWDDDADITMKRGEYEKFCAVAHELPAPYKFVTPEEYGGYFFDFVPRVLNLDEPLREETEEDRAQNNYQNRIAVDIFIIDEAPDENTAFKKMVLKQKMVYGMAMAHRFDRNRNKHGFIESLQVAFLGFFGRLTPLPRLFEKQKRISIKYRNSGKKYYCITNGLVKELKNRFVREAFDSSVKLTMHGTEFNCPQGWDTILTTYYGDYMTPPKPEDRISLHI